MGEAVRVAVVGLGLIGGSLAAALRRAGGYVVVGVDRDRGALEWALARGVVDEAADDAERGVEGAGLVVVAVHVGSIVPVVRSLAPHLRPGTVVTDVGSVKEAVVEAAEAALAPLGVRFVGGHPIAGRELSGVRNADPGLFEGRIAVLTPTASTEAGALERVRSMWEAAGSRVVTMDPAEHDRVFAWVSHLPHAVAYALVAAVLGGPDQRLARYAGGGFADFTRIAASSPEMWRDIFLANRPRVLEAIEGFRAALGELEQVLRSGEEVRLLEVLDRAARLKRGGRGR